RTSSGAPTHHIGLEPLFGDVVVVTTSSATTRASSASACGDTASNTPKTMHRRIKLAKAMARAGRLAFVGVGTSSRRTLLQLMPPEDRGIKRTFPCALRHLAPRCLGADGRRGM